MRTMFAAAVAALMLASPVVAQPIVPDLSAATPVPGRWAWTPKADGSEATFLDSSGRGQVWLHCVHASRVITIARPSSVAAPFMMVWTSSAGRNVASSFIPLTARLVVRLSAYDNLLDALAFSRGRIGVGVSGMPALVAPAWPEVARVVEDCRA